MGNTGDIGLVRYSLPRDGDSSAAKEANDSLLAHFAEPPAPPSDQQKARAAREAGEARVDLEQPPAPPSERQEDRQAREAREAKVDFVYVKKLLEQGADINVTDEFGQTLMHEVRIRSLRESPTLTSRHSAIQSFVLYYIALYMYCIVLYCTVLYCILLYCIVLYCILLYCIVLYCIVLYCIVLYCIVLHCIVWRDASISSFSNQLKAPQG